MCGDFVALREEQKTQFNPISVIPEHILSRQKQQRATSNSKVDLFETSLSRWYLKFQWDGL